MPKMKTKKALVGRFRLTGTGKLKRTRPGRRHILTKKSSKRKRQLGNPALVHDTVLRTYKKMLCVE